MNKVSRHSVALVLAVVLLPPLLPLTATSETAEGTPAPASMMGETPKTFNQVTDTVITMVQRGSYIQGTTWAKFSEEWYWEALIAKKPFRSVYADEGLQQPLIDSITINLSQTPREQCDREGIVTEGLEREGPGQEVELYGLQARPDLNGRRGRVLPSSGRGSPPSQPSAGRVAVRVAPTQPGKTPEVVSVKRANLAPVGACGGHTTRECSNPEWGAEGQENALPRRQQQQQQQRRQQQQQQQQQPPPNRQRILALLEEEFKLWNFGSYMTPASLRNAGMKDSLIRCGHCEKDGGESGMRFIALKRGRELSHKPLSHSSVQLRCIDCFADLAAAVGMPLTADGAYEFCEGHIMPPMEVAMVLHGMPMASWGGSSGFEGQLY